MKRLIIILLLAILPAIVGVSRENVTIKGSDTMVRLAQRWAEIYMAGENGIMIQVSGGGTGIGIAALINGATDICEASREMFPDEIELARKNGIDPYRISVALDGIAVFINDQNPVEQLTFAQLEAIYTGDVTNWKEVGGEDHTIIPYGRENTSGTYEFFKETVLSGREFADRTQTLPGTASVVNAVAKDRYGIGYGSLAWARDVKFVAVHMDSTDEAFIPNLRTISSGKYPITRELYWYFDGKPEGVVREITNWVLTEEAQKIALESGYIPLRDSMIVPILPD